MARLCKWEWPAFGPEFRERTECLVWINLEQDPAVAGERRRTVVGCRHDHVDRGRLRQLRRRKLRLGAGGLDWRNRAAVAAGFGVDEPRVAELIIVRIASSRRIERELLARLDRSGVPA